MSTESYNRTNENAPHLADQAARCGALFASKMSVFTCFGTEAIFTHALVPSEELWSIGASLLSSFFQIFGTEESIAENFVHGNFWIRVFSDISLIFLWKSCYLRDVSVFNSSFCTEFVVAYSSNQLLQNSLSSFRGRTFSKNNSLYLLSPNAETAPSILSIQIRIESVRCHNKPCSRRNVRIGGVLPR